MVKYIQGDVVGVYNSAGTKVVGFTYDAYGNCTIVSQQAGVGTLNPFRYRGYYWDSDLGLYYLQTRYYDPVTGRFINADGLEYLDPQTLGGINLYSYCGNNPIMETDPHGTIVLSAIIWGFVIGFVMSFTTSMVSQAIENDGKIGWEDVGVAVVEGLFGGVSGALAATGLVTNPFASVAIDFCLDFACNTITTGIENDWKFTKSDWADIGHASVASAVVSSILSPIGPDVDNSFLKYSNKQVHTINKKAAKGLYKNASKMARATDTAQSLVKQCFTKGHLTEEFIKSGVQNIIDAVLGGLCF